MDPLILILIIVCFLFYFILFVVRLINFYVVNKSSAGSTGTTSTIAALGTAWAHCVNTRLILQHFRNKRAMITIAKSPVSAVFSFPYEITGLLFLLLLSYLLFTRFSFSQDGGLVRTDDESIKETNNYWGDTEIRNEEKKYLE